MNAVPSEEAPRQEPPGEAVPFRVREAAPADNAALLALDRQCVMAAATPLVFDRSPDFFARSRPYPHWRAYVAEADQGLIGLAAMALKPVLLGGRRVETAYLYDLRVAPAFRRLGVAKAVGDAVRAHTRSLSPAAVYSLVMEGNVPSLAFAGSRGSRPLRPGVLNLIPLETVPAPGPERSRRLDLQELPAVLSLIHHAAHAGQDLFPFPDAAALRDRVERVEHTGFLGLYGWDRAGRLAGCFGLWNYAPVMRMRVLQAPGEWAWAGARDIHLIFLMPLGFREPEDLAEAVRLATARLDPRPPKGAARALAIAHDADAAGYTVLEVFHPLRLGFTVFGLDLGGAGSLPFGARPVFVDPADL